MEKNNLDNLFKEKLKDFGAKPDAKVWNRIESSLEAKRKKRVIPIWWQLGGVAALLTVILYFINPFRSTEEVDKSPTVVETEKTNDRQKISEPNLKKAGEIEITKIKSNENDISKTVDSINIGNKQDKNESLINNPALRDSQKQDGLVHANEKANHQNRSTNITAEIAVNNKNLKQKGRTKEVTATQGQKTKANVFENPKNDGIAQNKQQHMFSENHQVAEVEKSDKNREIDHQNRKGSTKEDIENTVVTQQNEDSKKSIYEAIEEQQKDDKALVAENNTGKWSMGAAFAPVYYGSTGEGSPIHSNFATNDKSGNINLSYGLQVSYNLGKKLSIRSGVHRVDFGYDTNEIEFSSSLESSTNALIDNIDYRTTARNLVVRSKPLENNGQGSVENTEILAENPTRDGRMVQQLGYIEVPFELNYALLDKKLGVNVIGGFSSLFLVDNAVSLEDTSNIMEMGNANNVNNLNFSTNIGLGIRYRFTQKMQFNLEPIFKYQLNAFSETAGNFNPYSIGVYSGINFRF